MRVLEEDASVTVQRAAEKAADAAKAPRAQTTAELPSAEAMVKPSSRMKALRGGDRRARGAARRGEVGLEVTDVAVVEAPDEPLESVAEPGDGEAELGTAADWLPGIKDEHDDTDQGWMARWLERPTWDRRVTPNVIKRTGQRPTARGTGRRRR